MLSRLVLRRVRKFSTSACPPPSSIDAFRMEMYSKFAEFDAKLESRFAAQNAKLAALENQLAAQSDKLADHDRRITALAYILQFYESILSAEKAIIQEILPDESYFLPDYLLSFSYLCSFRYREDLPENMENFYEHPLVKEIYEFIDSKEFRVLREYRNQIAHTNIRDISRLRSITRNLVDLIPQMPEQEALVIKVIKKKLPTIIKMVDEANKYS